MRHVFIFFATTDIESYIRPPVSPPFNNDLCKGQNIKSMKTGHVRYQIIDLLVF